MCESDEIPLETGKQPTYTFQRFLTNANESLGLVNAHIHTG